MLLGGFLLAARELSLDLVPFERGSCRIADGGGVIGELRNMLSNLVDTKAVGLCRNKAHILKTLRGICPVSEQAMFTLSEGEAALEHASERDFAVVVKSVGLAGGRCITTRIHSAEDFRTAWQRVLAVIAEQGGARPPRGRGIRAGDRPARHRGPGQSRLCDNNGTCPCHPRRQCDSDRSDRRKESGERARRTYHHFYTLPRPR